MPYFRDIFAYQQSVSNAFERSFVPGDAVVFPGIYRCCGCGFETVLTSSGTFPSEERCEGHTERWTGAKGEVRWQLVAAPINANG